MNEGNIPQLPGGTLTTFAVGADGSVDCATRKVIDVAGLAKIAPEDPEPEFVDINSRNEVVLSLQENNHFVIADLASAQITGNFSAGAVDLKDIDTEKDGVISLTGKKDGVPREPDAVQWIDDDRFVSANEGDLDGGSRGFTIFRKDGTVDYESGASLRARGRASRPLP